MDLPGTAVSVTALEITMNQPETFAGHLLAFYDQAARELPFRVNPRPYYTWISEIMLQQTRMETVIPYFNRFITALPDIAALAGVEEDQLLKLWEGLGYYSRARNLRRAACQIMADHGGEMPREYEALLKLPGIGPYTAGAIASIAFGEAVPAVDGNVIRVFSRLEALAEPAMTSRGKKFIGAAVERVIDRERPGDFNQAVMELGATICLPNGAPLCQSCPVAAHCLALAQGDPLAYPILPAKKSRRIEAQTVLLVTDGQDYLIEQRPDAGLLAGLLQFPMRPGKLSWEDADAWLRSLGFDGASLEPGPPARHIFSHVEWQMSSWIVRLDSRRDGEARGDLVCEAGDGPRLWLPGTSLDEITLPTAFRTYRQVMAAILSENQTMTEPHGQGD